MEKHHFTECLKSNLQLKLETLKVKVCACVRGCADCNCIEKFAKIVKTLIHFKKKIWRVFVNKIVDSTRLQLLYICWHNFSDLITEISKLENRD